MYMYVEHPHAVVLNEECILVNELSNSSLSDCLGVFNGWFLHLRTII